MNLKYLILYRQPNKIHGKRTAWGGQLEIGEEEIENQNVKTETQIKRSQDRKNIMVKKIYCQKKENNTINLPKLNSNTVKV